MTKWQAKGKKLKNVLELDESFKNYETVFQVGWLADNGLEY